MEQDGTTFRTDTPSPGNPEPPAAANVRVAASIDNWKRKLLDLTKRNRALNFKVSKVSTVTIVDELAPEVFRHLYLNERPMRFRAAPDEDGSSRAESDSGPVTNHAAGASTDDWPELVFEEEEDDALHN